MNIIIWNLHHKGIHKEVSELLISSETSRLNRGESKKESSRLNWMPNNARKTKFIAQITGFTLNNNDKKNKWKKKKIKTVKKASIQQ